MNCRWVGTTTGIPGPMRSDVQATSHEVCVKIELEREVCTFAEVSTPRKHVVNAYYAIPKYGNLCSRSVIFEHGVGNSV